MARHTTALGHRFNPIAPTYLTSALKSLLVRLASSYSTTSSSSSSQPSSQLSTSSSRRSTANISQPSMASSNASSFIHLPPTSPHAKRLIDTVVSGAGGDVRSAVMSLQFGMRRVGGGVGGIESGGTEREDGKKATKAKKG